MNAINQPNVTVNPRTKLFSALGLIFLLAVSFTLTALPLPYAWAGSPGNSGKSTCVDAVIPQIQTLEHAIDSRQAVALAEQSQEFRTNVAGHNYSFSGISDSSTFNPATC